MLIHVISGIHLVTWRVRGKRPDADAATAAPLAAAQKPMELARAHGGRVKCETTPILPKEPSDTCFKDEHKGQKKNKSPNLTLAVKYEQRLHR